LFPSHSAPVNIRLALLVSHSPEVLVVAPQMLAESPYAAKEGFATAAAPAACRKRSEGEDVSQSRRRCDGMR
jgi:hypothetical protein